MQTQFKQIKFMKIFIENIYSLHELFEIDANLFSLFNIYGKNDWNFDFNISDECYRNSIKFYDEEESFASPKINRNWHIFSETNFYFIKIYL